MDIYQQRLKRRKLAALGLLGAVWVSGVVAGVAVTRFGWTDFIAAPGVERRADRPDGRRGDREESVDRRDRDRNRRDDDRRDRNTRRDRNDDDGVDTRYLRRLDLTQEQQDRIDEILERRRRDSERFWATEGAILRATVDSAQAEILSVLTPDQRARYDRLRSSRGRSRSGRR